jgi:hypothetical protein
MAKKSSRGSGAGKVILGFLFGVAVAVGAGYVWLHQDVLPSTLRGRLPSSPAASSHRSLKSNASPKAPVERHRPVPPFGISEDVFEAGAHIYTVKCANCHGVPGHEASFGKQMRPAATQFWRKASNVQVSREDPGDIYEKIAAGVQGTGMPAFRHVLSDTEIWQVSLLLKNAGKEIPDPVQNILRGKQ